MTSSQQLMRPSGTGSKPAGPRGTPGDQAFQAARGPPRERRVRLRGPAAARAVLPDRHAGEQPPQVARRTWPVVFAPTLIELPTRGLCRRLKSNQVNQSIQIKSNQINQTNWFVSPQTANAVRSAVHHLDATLQTKCTRKMLRDRGRTSSAAASRAGARSSAHRGTRSARAGCWTGSGG